MMAINLSKYIYTLDDIQLPNIYGKVTQVVGLVIHGVGISGSIGDLCTILPSNGRNKDVRTEIVGFVDSRLLLMPFGEIHGIRSSDRIKSSNRPLDVTVGDQLLGRTVDALGNPIDGLGTLFDSNDPKQTYPVHNVPP